MKVKTIRFYFVIVSFGKDIAYGNKLSSIENPERKSPRDFFRVENNIKTGNAYLQNEETENLA